MTKKKNILVTGGRGFIGSHFLSFFAGGNINSTNQPIYSQHLKYSIIAPSHQQLDITDKKSIMKIYDEFFPEVIVNFAAHRDANTAEKQRGDRKGSVWKSNVLGVKNLYEVGKKYGAYIIHISTDMVFSGKEDNPGPYDENTKPDRYLRNLSWYGWTKAEGERILYNKKNVAIIRIGNVTRPIYDPKADYVGKILYLFNQGKLYPLFADQYLTLSSIPHLFDMISKLIKKRMNGVFHAASSNLFTPYQMAEYLINKTYGKKNVIKAISIDSYLKSKKNRYPKRGGLLSKMSTERLKMGSYTWQEFLELSAIPHFKNRI